MKEALCMQFASSVAIFALFFVSVRADGVRPIKDIPVTLLKTGARTFSGLGLQAESPSTAQEQDHQHAITEEDGKILAAILKEAEQKQAAEAAGDEVGEYEEDGRDYYEDDEDDERCPVEGEIFFEKSGQCVPRKCPSGTRRDLETGFCHKKLTGLSRFGVGRWSYSPNYHRSSFSRYAAPRSRLMYPRFRG